MSPKVFALGRFRVSVIPGDHLPPHVHVLTGSGSGDIMVYLDQNSSPRYEKNKSASEKDAKEAVKLVDATLEKCRSSWKEYNPNG